MRDADSTTTPAASGLLEQHAAATAEAARLEAEATKIETVLAGLHEQLAGVEARAAAAADGVGAAMVAALLDGRQAPADDKALHRVTAERTALAAAIAHADARLAATTAALTATRARAAEVVDAVAQAEADRAALALLDAWKVYRACWHTYEASCSVAGRHVSRGDVERVEVGDLRVEVARVSELLTDDHAIADLIDNGIVAKLRTGAR